MSKASEHVSVTPQLSSSCDSEKEIGEPTAPPEDEALDTKYAWVICACCAVCNFTTWGLNSAFAVYYQEFVNSGQGPNPDHSPNARFPFATKMELNYIGGLSYGGGLLLSPFVNMLWVYLGDYGLTTIFVAGSACQVSALLLASFSNKLWQLFLTQGVLQSIGLSLISFPALTLPSMYFSHHKRVLASSIAAAASGFGGILFNLMCGRIVEIKSVPWAMRSQAIIAFSLMLFPILAARDRPGGRFIPKFNALVYRQLGFWLLSLFTAFSMLGYIVLLYSLGQFVTSLGYSSKQGFLTSAMVNLGGGLGRPIVGLLSDRPKLGPVTMSMFANALAGVFCLAMWIPARNYATCIAFAILVGATMGTIFGMLAPTCARVFGEKNMRFSFSNQWVVLGVSAVFSPVIGAKLKRGGGGITDDPTQYLNVAIWVGMCYIGCALFLLLLRGYVKARDALIEHDTEGPENPRVPLRMILTHMFTTKYGKI
ncbi:probable transporter Mch2p [Diutina catenulata]